MKRSGIFLIKIIFFLIVSFNIGNDAHACFGFNPDRIDFIAGSDSDENKYYPDLDSMNEDQISQSDSTELIMDDLDQTSISCNCRKVKRLFFSVWQPPKIS